MGPVEETFIYHVQAAKNSITNTFLQESEMPSLDEEEAKELPNGELSLRGSYHSAQSHSPTSSVMWRKYYCNIPSQSMKCGITATLFKETYPCIIQ